MGAVSLRLSSLIVRELCGAALALGRVAEKGPPLLQHVVALSSNELLGTRSVVKIVIYVEAYSVS